MEVENVTDSVKSVDDMPNIIWNATVNSAKNISEFVNDTGILFESDIDGIASINSNLAAHDELQGNLPLFAAFVVIEIVMTALAFIILVVTAFIIPRWKKNYRNQMLIQLSLARFLKRIVCYIEFREEKYTSPIPENRKLVLFAAETYIDIVVVIIVVYFIKHMYDTLLVVIVKINRNTLLKMSCCAWLLPLPLVIASAVIISHKLVNEWWTHLFICCILRWPLILIGTAFYIAILYRVLTDKIRKFARSLTITTFFVCLIANFYLFSKDVIELWCFKSFITVLINYLLGFFLNSLILMFFLILVILNYKKTCKSTTSVTIVSINNEGTK